jgi:hypothetical protein
VPIFSQKAIVEFWAMRISEDRYDRDRQRLELALRLLTHEARTQTIRVWTGLSDDRIRKLYRSYLWRASCYVPRHRGKSPHQAAYFIRSLRIQQETAVLASDRRDLVRVRGLPRGLPGAGRSAADRQVLRLRRHHRRRALPHPGEALPALRRRGPAGLKARRRLIESGIMDSGRDLCGRRRPAPVPPETRPNGSMA